MAINKVITNASKTHGAMRKVIEYVLQEQKIKDKYVAVTGPYDATEINVNNVMQAFVAEKQLWQKDSGRMYMHSTVSFHKDEKITPQQALEFGIKLAEGDAFYKDFQTLVVLHQDTDRLHIHFVSNTVSYINGRKEQHNKADIEGLMQRTSELCRQMGLSVTEKGRHFDGAAMKTGEITSNRTKTYRLLCNDAKESYLVNTMVAIDSAVRKASDRNEFIKVMQEQGYKVNWSDTRKYVTFEDLQGHKVRNHTLGKTFNIEWLQDKEMLDEYIRETRDAEEYIGADAGTGTEDYDTIQFDTGFARGTASVATQGIHFGEQVVRTTINKANREQQKKNRHR